MTPEMSILEKLVTTSIVGSILLIIVWKLPTIISLFMENRKEVAAIMDKQSANFTETVKQLLDSHKAQNENLINKFENRFANIETTLQNVCHVLERNQKTIEDLLESHNDTKRKVD